MVIEKESERPALKLCDEHATDERFWAIYNPLYREYGCNGSWWCNIENAQRFATIDAAKKEIRKNYCQPACAVFIELSVKVHFGEKGGSSEA